MARRRVGRRIAGLAVAVVGLGMPACEDAGSGGSDPAAPDAEPLASEPLSPSRTARCGEAMLGDAAGGGWRGLSADEGPFGFFGAGGDFASGDFDYATRRGVKIPAIVVGADRVIVSIAPRDRDRAALQYGFTGDRTAAPVRRIAFEPCTRREATSWPGGLRLTDQSRPVAVRIEVEGETEPRELVVGELDPREASRAGL